MDKVTGSNGGEKMWTRRFSNSQMWLNGYVAQSGFTSRLIPFREREQNIGVKVPQLRDARIAAAVAQI